MSEQLNLPLIPTVGEYLEKEYKQGKGYHPGYVAGIVDADGCITITKNTRDNKYMPQLLISGHSRMNLYKWLKDKFNGNIFNDNQKGMSYYRIENNRTEVVIRWLLPHLLEKQQEARLLIDAINNPSNLKSAYNEMKYWKDVRYGRIPSSYNRIHKKYNSEYVSGFFDGDGHTSIILHKHKHQRWYYAPIVAIRAHRNDNMYKWLSGQFGGSWSPRKNRVPPFYQAYTSNAGKFLRWVLPHIFEKREEALLVLECIHLCSTNNQLDGLHSHFSRLKTKLSQLKKERYSHD